MQSHKQHGFIISCQDCPYLRTCSVMRRAASSGELTHSPQLAASRLSKSSRISFFIGDCIGIVFAPLGCFVALRHQPSILSGSRRMLSQSCACIKVGLPRLRGLAERCRSCRGYEVEPLTAPPPLYLPDIVSTHIVGHRLTAFVAITSSVGDGRSDLFVG